MKKRRDLSPPPLRRHLKIPYKTIMLVVSP